MLLHSRIAQGFPRRHQLASKHYPRLKPRFSIEEQVSLERYRLWLAVCLALVCMLCVAVIELTSPGLLDASVYASGTLNSDTAAIVLN